jgi:hypothetical protein
MAVSYVVSHRVWTMVLYDIVCTTVLYKEQSFGLFHCVCTLYGMCYRIACARWYLVCAIVSHVHEGMISCMRYRIACVCAIVSCVHDVVVCAIVLCVHDGTVCAIVSCVHDVVVCVRYRIVCARCGTVNTVRAIVSYVRTMWKYALSYRVCARCGSMRYRIVCARWYCRASTMAYRYCVYICNIPFVFGASD